MEIGFAKEAARYSAIAQLVEQATVNRPVVGSSPTRGATFLPLHRCFITLFLTEMHSFLRFSGFLGYKMGHKMGYKCS